MASNYVSVTGITLIITADIVTSTDCFGFINSVDIIIDGGLHFLLWTVLVSLFQMLYWMEQAFL